MCAESGLDQASPHLYAATFAGGVTGSVMVPGNRSGGQCRDSVIVSS